MRVLCVRVRVCVCLCGGPTDQTTKAVLKCLQHRFDCLLEELYCAAMAVAKWSREVWRAVAWPDDLTGRGNTALLFLRWLTGLEEFLTSVTQWLQLHNSYTMD